MCSISIAMVMASAAMSRARPVAVRAIGVVVRALAVSGSVVVIGTATADAELRTGRAVVQYPDSTSAEFPGLRAVALRYDDVTGAFEVTARLRSAMSDPAVTSALRSTVIDVSLDDSFADEDFADSCNGWIDGLSVTLLLGHGQANVALGDPFEDGDDVVVPLVVSPDRRTVSATVPADPRIGARNIVCLHAHMRGPEGFATGAPADFTRKELLEGFAPDDGNIGLYAQDDVESQFRYIYNNLTGRDRDDISDHPSWRASCTPRRGSIFVRCHGRGRIDTIVGKPTVFIKGRREFSIVRDRDMFGLRGHLLRWRQAMRVTTRWKRCPRAIDAGRARRQKPCQVRLVWRTGRFLPEVLVRALIRRAKRTGIPPKQPARAAVLLTDSGPSQRRRPGERYRRR
jgi:hypothetical protein